MRTWKQSTRILKNEHGQDLIEYAMIAGFIAVVSGMFMPGAARDISTVYSKVSCVVKDLDLSSKSSR